MTQANAPTPTRLMVVLEHAIPGQSAHFDWMIDVDGLSPLLSLRTHTNPVAARGEFLCEKRPDHRRVYLEFEGELSEGRGSVRRVARGEITRLALAGNNLSFEAVVARQTMAWRVERTADGTWTARRLALD